MTIFSQKINRDSRVRENRGEAVERSREEILKFDAASLVRRSVTNSVLPLQSRYGNCYFRLGFLFVLIHHKK